VTNKISVGKPLIRALLICATLATTSATAVAQDLIRVESNEVLVPALVVDEVRLHELQGNGTRYWAAIRGGNLLLAQKIVDDIAILDLSASDFRIFEDGQPQVIRNISRRRSLIRDVRDNKGLHTEYIGPGGGKWSTREWLPGSVSSVLPAHYLIAYTPPESPVGSCHKIKIRVNRRHALILARGEYCNFEHLTSDPLRATTLGEQMEGKFALANVTKEHVSLTAVPLYNNGNDSRIHIALDWPSKSVESQSSTLSILGMVFNSDGGLNQRFSDIAEFEPGGVEAHTRVFGDDTLSDFAITRYETQLILSPGRYHLKVVLSDGKTFAQAEIPLVVDTVDRKSLSMSAVSICKQIQRVPDPTSLSLPNNWAAQSLGNYSPLVSNEIEFAISGNSRFKKNEILYLYFEVFGPFHDPSTIQIQMRIVNLKTGEVKTDPGSVDAAFYAKPGASVIPVGRGRSLNDLSAGSYRLEVRAIDSEVKSTAWHSVNFSVE
jgi:hypothetical protein